VEVDRKLSIRPGDVVLDVGSGDRPHPLASVLVDRFLDDSSQRHGSPLVMDRPVVAADVSRLPFRDKTFDYVIASHVLEHHTDPIGAARELSRVARRGYVETPTEIWELILGWDFHVCVAYLDPDGTIVFKRKSRPVSPLGELGFRLAEVEPLLEDLIRNHPDLFYVSLEWSDFIPCRFASDLWPDSVHTTSFIARLHPVRPRLSQAVRALSRALLPVPWEWHHRRAVRRRLQTPLAVRAKGRRVDLDGVLACPACLFAPLRLSAAQVQCSACDARYERRHGVPIMLVPAEAPPGFPPPSEPNPDAVTSTSPVAPSGRAL
jgi:SAM-dependent methyltransferase